MDIAFAVKVGQDLGGSALVNGGVHDPLNVQGRGWRARVRVLVVAVLVAGNECRTMPKAPQARPTSRLIDLNKISPSKQNQPRPAGGR